MAAAGIPFLDQDEVQATHYINFLSGAFQAGKWRIPFFTSTLTFKEASEDLKLTTDLPGSQSANLTIGELFQREIDWSRVEGPLLQYLKNENEPQFFNALTVALMPFNDVEGRVEAVFDQGGDWRAPTLASEEKYAKCVSVGPIRMCFYENWTSPDDTGFLLGKMRWNKDQVHAVAIDGQHRLAAIKQFTDMKKHSKSRVPVIFLIFDPRVGFTSSESVDMTQMMRTIFIDLNKHARNVSRARQILLDDRDPFSRCVRTVLSGELSDGMTALESDPPCLPLSLVDWHSEQAKFDRGPYITTILGLEWLVSLVLGQKTIADPTNYSKFESQISKLSFRLGVNLSDASSRLETAKETLTAFGYSDADLDAISEGFRLTWNRPIVTLFTRFAPYRDFIKLRQSNDSDGLQWQWWFKLFAAAAGGSDQAEKEYSTYLLELQTSDPPISGTTYEKILSNLNEAKAGNLAFNVVFQRAFFQAFYIFLQFTEADIAQFEQWGMGDQIDIDDIEIDDLGKSMSIPTLEGSSDDVDQNEEMATLIGHESLAEHKELVRSLQFADSMNALIDGFPSLLSIAASVESPDGSSVDFWAGSLQKPEGGIDFTQVAAVRAADLIYLTSSLALLKSQLSEDVDFDDIWAELLDGSDFEPFKKMAWAARRLWKDQSSVAGRILKAREIDYEPNLAQAEIEIRLRSVWDSLSS